MDKESRNRGTNNYKGIAILTICISVFVDIILIGAGETISGIIVLSSGLLLFLTFLFMYSVCYRLDLIIDKK